MPDRFHNPYNFIPALPRIKAAETELGDRKPTPHDRYYRDRWSGKITVTLTTETPLLIPDASRATGTDHKTYPLRVMDGKPYVAPTSIKGMLRSEYEMITNSRLSVFNNHQERLAYRAPADARNIYPAIVAKRKDGQKILRILEAKEVFARVGRLPRYKKRPQSNEWDKGETEVSLTYHNSEQLPMHGERVWVRLNPSNQYAQDLPRAVRQNLSRNPMPNVVTRIQPREPNSQPPGAGDWHKGWVCITGANINGKVYERVFIEAVGDPVVRITPELELLWQELITNYQKEHKLKIEERQQRGQSAADYLGDDPGQTGYSRHVYQPRAAELRLGTLCYVELQPDADLAALSPGEVVALFPVTISRRLYPIAPQSLLDESLKPATTLSQLSPADRVFGWVNSNGQGAYRGNLRIYGVRCLDDDAIQSFEPDGLTLAILGQPKEQQARFYLAKDQTGAALDAETPKEQGYQPGQALRGRKVYPHQNVPEGYWNAETTHPIDGFYREYRQVDDEKSTQNRTIKAWVKPKSRFQFEIELTNLSSVELGALLWLLRLPDGQFHRLGGGKPFGFGSVKLEMTQLEVQTGEQRATYYRSLLGIPGSPETRIESLIEAFRSELKNAYGESFQNVPFIAAFSKASQGVVQPVHYPRITKAPQPEGESFEWFVQNEQGDKRSRGARLALPDLVTDQGLPYSPVTNNQAHY